MVTDMTVGAPSKLLWKFSIPILFSVVFQQLYGIVDSVVAGQFIGEDAVAAIGASYPITMIFMAFATGLNGGCSVVISQLFGAKQFDKMKEGISTSLISSAVICVILMGLGFISCSTFMHLLNTPSNIFTDAMVYLNVYIAGLLFLFLYNICNGIFTALGDSKTPLYFLIASSIGNIILDLLFVIQFNMGVAGVAWATFIAQGSASILAVVVLTKRVRKIESGPYKKYSYEMMKKMSRIAVPSILQSSFVSVGNLFIQGLINSYGSEVIAGYSIAIKLNTFAITSFNTMASGLSSFAAQNIGAGKTERVKQGFRTCIGMSVVVVLPFLIAYLGFGRTMISLFVSNGSEAAIQVGIEFLYIVAPFYLILLVKLLGDSVLRGGGVMGQFMITTFSDLVIRVMLSFLFSSIWGATGIWLSWPVGWTMGTVLSFLFYKSGKWEHGYK